MKMMSVLPITKWYQIHRSENGDIIKKTFNHFEQGHIKGEYPLPFKEEFSNQKGWAKLEWESVHTSMVIYVGHNGISKVVLS